MKLRMINKSKWGEVGNSVELCQLPFSVAEMESNFDIVFFEYQEDGLGNLYGAYVEIDGFKLYLQGTPPRESNENGVLVMIRSIESSPSDCLNMLCNYLSLTVDALLWVMDNLSPPSWVLYRVDDNDNEVEMFRFLNESSAECLRLDYEKKGHKQGYYVRKL